MKIREIHAENAINYSPGNDPAGFYDRREDLGDDQETQAEDFGETGLKERSLEVRDETEDDDIPPCTPDSPWSDCILYEPLIL